MNYEILADFLRYPAGDTEMEELYTNTFDIHAICFLEVGYVLFGEDYKRGHLLVKLQELLQEFDVDSGHELADHLPNLLTLLPRLNDARPEEAKALVGKIILPALDKMLQGFSEKGNPYAEPLKAVKSLLESDFPDCRGEARLRPIELPAYRNNEFLGSDSDGRDL